MRYSPTIKYLLDIIAKSSKSLLRDYNELVYMQSSIKPTDQFVQRSRTRSASLIIDEIDYQKKYLPNILVDGQFKNQNSKYTVIIEPLDGVINFQHALPFFAIAVSLKDDDRDEVIASVVEIPTLREVFFAEKNNGAWHDSYLNSASSGGRLRVAQRAEISAMYFAADHFIDKLKSQTLMINASLIALSMFSFGRFDACVFNNLSKEHKTMSELIIKESGGSVYQYKESMVFAYDKSYAELKKILG
jgi:fructose-1,6-bisphosphatase/inositol monophosphatase family enzyme